MTTRDVRFLIDDMQTATADIATMIDGIDFSTFCADRMRQKAVIHDFEVLGEAAGRLPPEIRA